MGPTKEVNGGYKCKANSRMAIKPEGQNAQENRRKSHTLIDISTKRQLWHKRLALRFLFIHLWKHDRNRDEQLRLRTLCRLGYNNFESIFNADTGAHA